MNTNSTYALPSILVGLLTLFSISIAPASAFADKRVTVRAELNNSLTQSDRVSYANQQYNDYSADGLAGVIHIGENSEYLVLEGPDSNVDTEITDLQNNWRTTSVSVVAETDELSWNLGGLSSHTEDDLHATFAAESFNQNERRTLRAEVDSGVDAKQFADTYSNAIAKDGLGGVMIIGEGDNWIEVELEGDPTYVQYWIKKFKRDTANLSNIEVVSVESDVSDTHYSELSVHLGTDEQNP